jgi:hypothetical protein
MTNVSTAAPYARAEGVATKPRFGFFRRVLAAVMEAQQRRADREVARILSRYADTPRHVIEGERELKRRIHPLGEVR